MILCINGKYHYMGTQIHLIKVLVVLTFTYKFSLEGFWEGHEGAYDVSCKVYFLIAYHILLTGFGGLLIELHALKLTKGFQQWLAHIFPLLVSH